MADSIGLIERAAALLRQQEPLQPETLPHPVPEADTVPATPELIQTVRGSGYKAVR